MTRKSETELLCLTPEVCHRNLTLWQSGTVVVEYLALGPSQNSLGGSIQSSEDDSRNQVGTDG